MGPAEIDSIFARTSCQRTPSPSLTPEQVAEAEHPRVRLRTSPGSAEFLVISTRRRMSPGFGPFDKKTNHAA